MRDEIINLIKESTGVSVEVNDATTFKDLGMDSLDMVQAVMDIEDRYGITVGEDLAFETVGEFITYIEGLKK